MIPPLPLDDVDRRALTRYYELLDRYQNLEPKIMMSLLAIRLLCMKHGYGTVVGAMRSQGEDLVVMSAQAQLRDMVTIWRRMVHSVPPPPQIHQGVMENIAMVRKASDDPDVRARLYKQLLRRRIREDWLSQRDRVPKSRGH